MKSLMRVEKAGRGFFLLYLKQIKVSFWEQHQQHYVNVISAVPSVFTSISFTLLLGRLLSSKWSRMMHCNASSQNLESIFAATYTHSHFVRLINI